MYGFCRSAIRNLSCSAASRQPLGRRGLEIAMWEVSNCGAGDNQREDHSLDVAERLVAEGTADYIALSRPLICEPDLVSRWKSGDTAKSACVSDNRCFNPARNGEGLRCTLWEKVSKENGTIAK